MSLTISKFLPCLTGFFTEKSSNQNKFNKEKKNCTIRSIDDWKTNFFNYNCKELENFLNVEFTGILKNLNFEDFEVGTNVTNLKEYVLKNEVFLTLPSVNAVCKPRHGSKVVNFFTNFIENLVDALNFFDGNEPPSNIYERHVGIQIYYQFLKIPLAIAGLLQPFIVVAWQVYAVTLAILTFTSSSIYVYMNRLRPFPTTIPFCESIEETINQEYPYPIRGLDHEAGLMVAQLNEQLGFDNARLPKKCRPLMLIAETGQGKTTLVYKLHQMIKNGEVPEGLKNKKIFLIKGGKMIAKSSLGIGDKIKIIESRLKGHEKNAIVFIDEVHAFAKNPSNLELIKDFLRNSSIQFIVANTLADFNKIKNEDSDYSFRRPLFYLAFNKWEDHQLKSMLTEMIYRSAQDILFDDGVIEKIIELSNQHLPAQSQPTKASKLLESVIKKCRTNFECFQSEDLPKHEMELMTLTLQHLCHNLELEANGMDRIRELQSKIQEMKNHKKATLEKAIELKKIIRIKNKFNHQLTSSSSALTKSYTENSPPDEELKKKYLFIKFHVLPAIGEITEKFVSDLKGEMDVVVNSELVQKVFESYKLIEEGAIDQK